MDERPANKKLNQIEGEVQVNASAADNDAAMNAEEVAPPASQPTLLTAEKLQHSWSVSRREAIQLTIQLAISLFVKCAVPLLLINLIPILVPSMHGIFEGLPAFYILGLAVVLCASCVIFCFVVHRDVCTQDTRISFTNRRIMKFGIKEDILDFEHSNVELSVKKIGSQSGLLTFTAPGTTSIEMFSTSLQSDLQKLPEQLSRKR